MATKFKSSKWDNPNPSSPLHTSEEASPSIAPATTVVSKKDAAAEAAARINAMLVAKGVLKPSQVSANKATNGIASVVAEVDINDISPSARLLLMKASTHEEIAKMSGTVITVKGRFLTEEEKKTSGTKNALYLHVQGTNKASVDKATAKIKEMIDGFQRKRPSRFNTVATTTPATVTVITPQPTTASSSLSSGMAFVQDKVFVGMENVKPDFDIRNKLLGPNNMYIMHIQAETAAKVTLRGLGSGHLESTSGREAFEPLHIHLQHATTAGLQNAKKLAESLIETVQQEYAKWEQTMAAMPPTISAGTASILAGLQQHQPYGGARPYGLPPTGLPTAYPPVMPPVGGVAAFGAPAVPPYGYGAPPATNLAPAAMPLPSSVFPTLPPQSVPPVVLPSGLPLFAPPPSGATSLGYSPSAVNYSLPVPAPVPPPPQQSLSAMVPAPVPPPSFTVTPVLPVVPPVGPSLSTVQTVVPGTSIAMATSVLSVPRDISTCVSLIVPSASIISVGPHHLRTATTVALSVMTQPASSGMATAASGGGASTVTISASPAALPGSTPDSIIKPEGVGFVPLPSLQPITPSSFQSFGTVPSSASSLYSSRPAGPVPVPMPPAPPMPYQPSVGAVAGYSAPHGFVPPNPVPMGMPPNFLPGGGLMPVRGIAPPLSTVGPPLGVPQVPPVTLTQPMPGQVGIPAPTADPVKDYYSNYVPDTHATKRRFTEEKEEEKIPVNLLGYEHGPPPAKVSVESAESTRLSSQAQLIGGVPMATRLDELPGNAGLSGAAAVRPDADRAAFLHPPPSTMPPPLLPPPSSLPAVIKMKKPGGKRVANIPAGHLPPPDDKPVADGADKSKDSSGWLAGIAASYGSDDDD